MIIDERWTRPGDIAFPIREEIKDSYPITEDFDLRVQSCFLYEYARSSPKCVEEVELLRSEGIILLSTVPGLVGDSRKKAVSLAEYAQNHNLPVGDFERVKLLTFVGRFEGFPDTPWHLQSDQVEDSLIDLGSERLPWIGKEGEPKWTTNPSAMAQSDARLEDRFDLWIDWRLSNDRILDVLRDQLKDTRPPEFPEPDGHRSNYCVYAGTNFPFRFLTALDWLGTRRRAASLDHSSRSGDFWNAYVQRFKGEAHVSESNARQSRQQADNAAAILAWFSHGGRLTDPSGKGRILHQTEGKSD